MQHELLPELHELFGALTPKVEKGIPIPEWVRIKEFVAASWCGMGRPPHDDDSIVDVESIAYKRLFWLVCILARQ